MSQAPSGSREANLEAKQMKAAGRKSWTRNVESGRSAKKPERETRKKVNRDAKAAEKQKSKSKSPFGSIPTTKGKSDMTGKLGMKAARLGKEKLSSMRA